MQLNETQKKAIEFNKIVRDRFGDKVRDFCIVNIINDANHQSFSVEFNAYDYFPIKMNYDRGRFGCAIVFGERQIALENNQKWWDEIDFNIFLDELQQEIELRIPDKFLKQRGWI